MKSSEWIKFRMNCLSRELTFDLDKRRKTAARPCQILLDIDKAISIIRQTERETNCPHLMAGFDIGEFRPVSPR